jgi:hypothetical protein
MRSCTRDFRRELMRDLARDCKRDVKRDRAGFWVSLVAREGCVAAELPEGSGAG